MLGQDGITTAALLCLSSVVMGGLLLCELLGSRAADSSHLPWTLTWSLGGLACYSGIVSRRLVRGAAGSKQTTLIGGAYLAFYLLDLLGCFRDHEVTKQVWVFEVTGAIIALPLVTQYDQHSFGKTAQLGAFKWLRLVAIILFASLLILIVGPPE